jgi:hypothetical protein
MFCFFVCRGRDSGEFLRALISVVAGSFLQAGERLLAQDFAQVKHW